jgi:sodium/bile acid cotransporter 7
MPPPTRMRCSPIRQEGSIVKKTLFIVADWVNRRPKSILRRIFSAFEPFVFALVCTVLIASLVPARGPWVAFFSAASRAGTVLLFFLHGAKLSRDAILAGALNWKLQLAVLAATYLLFPLLGLCFAELPLLTGAASSGLLFLTLLPSTVQSSIAFTAIARGNVSAAVCSATFSNLIGVFLTPLLTVLLMNRNSGGFSFGAFETIVLQLLLPFAAGHLLRPIIGSFITRRKQVVSIVDRGSILLVVYTAFGSAVVGGLWSMLSRAELALIALSCTFLLAIVLGTTWTAGKLLAFSRGDRIVLLFCGSKKSLASGVAIASVLFPSAQVGVAILPLMLFHQIQLIASAIIARHYADSTEDVCQIGVDGLGRVGVQR